MTVGSERLCDFFCNYQGLVDKLCKRYSGGADGSEEAYMTGKLRHWLEKQGYFLIYATVEQLFFIPGQFAREFLKDKIA